MSEVKFPFVEILKSIPGVVGIRLEEEPKYDVVEKIDDVEIRKYAPARLAEVTVSGTHEEAVDAAFERLAGYLFGGNAKREDLHMTNPVYQGEGSRLPLTTPLVQSTEAGKWTLAFFLTNDLSEEPPRPDDASIRLTRSPERVVAALRYRGNNNEEHMHDARKELLDTLRTHGKYEVDGNVYWAQYDAPWVIPFLKRNEAMVELATPVAAA